LYACGLSIIGGVGVLTGAGLCGVGLYCGCIGGGVGDLVGVGLRSDCGFVWGSGGVDALVR
jgi:hypothetical protein